MTPDDVRTHLSLPAKPNRCTNMQSMAATPVDVLKEFQGRISALPVAFAHALFQHDRNTFVFTTFFDEVESVAEEQLASVETYMVDAFSEYTIDFHTIHLFGRDVMTFIPDGAIPLIRARQSAPQRASVA
jgi:hypothetical protein